MRLFFNVKECKEGFDKLSVRKNYREKFRNNDKGRTFGSFLHRFSIHTANFAMKKNFQQRS